MNGNRPPTGLQYFCRGCGDALPPEWHGQFHPECLKADKRRRTQEKRRSERERFQSWLQRQHCPECGVQMGVRPGRSSATNDSPAALGDFHEPQLISQLACVKNES